MLTSMGEALKKAGIVNEEEERGMIERYKQAEKEAEKLIEEQKKLDTEHRDLDAKIQHEKNRLANAEEKLAAFEKGKASTKVLGIWKDNVRQSKVRLGKLNRDKQKLQIRSEILLKQMSDVYGRL